jgi:AraC family transcriptional regulator of adaptative response/methylated-DNA-[protein]-cysteine methyltransferase
MKNPGVIIGHPHRLCVALLAATLREARSGGAGLEIRWGVSESPFGKMFLAQSPRGITHLSFFDGDEAESLDVLRGDLPAASKVRDDRMVREIAGEIFTQQSRGCRLHVKGTPFQLKVWGALMNIPEGVLSTYGKLAAEIRMEGAARAVANAVGANRISYLIPCHRVIRASGELGGYRWGQDRKRAMLAWEKSLTPR